VERPAPPAEPPAPVEAAIPTVALGPGVVPPGAADETAEIPAYQSSAGDREFYESLRGPEPVGPRRAMAGALLALGGVVLGIVLLYAFRHDGDGGQGPTVALPTTRPSARATSPAPRTSAHPTTRPSVRPTAGPTTAPLAAPIRPVWVLNNSRIHHLADRSAAKFRAGGWPVRGTGNYRGGTIAQTTIYYAPGQLGSAQRFAKQFDIPRVRPRFSGLPGSGLTVVVTRDYR
jgi:hypothetical protein